LSEGFIEDEGQPDATLAVLNCDILRCRGHVVVAQPVDNNNLRATTCSSGSVSGFASSSANS
jgi:hypothetical protein